MAKSTNPSMHQFHISEYSIQSRNVHIFVLNGAIKHSGIWNRCILGFVKLVYQGTGLKVQFGHNIPHLRECSPFENYIHFLALLCEKSDYILLFLVVYRYTFIRVLNFELPVIPLLEFWTWCYQFPPEQIVSMVGFLTEFENKIKYIQF